MSSFTTLRPIPLVNIAPSIAAPLGIGAVGFSVVQSRGGMLNGRLRGNANQDVAGTLLIEFGNVAGLFDLGFVVTQDVTQAGFQYPFDVIILQPFVRISFTNGGAASAFFRANVEVLPV